MSWEASITIGMASFLWMMIITAFLLDGKKHAGIKTFLLLTAFFLGVPLLNYGRILAVDNAASAAMQNAIVSFFTTAIFIISVTSIYMFYYWVVSILEMMRDMNKKRKEKKGDVNE